MNGPAYYPTRTEATRGGRFFAEELPGGFLRKDKPYSTQLVDSAGAQWTRKQIEKLPKEGGPSA